MAPRPVQNLEQRPAATPLSAVRDAVRRNATLKRKTAFESGMINNFVSKEKMPYIKTVSSRTTKFGNLHGAEFEGSEFITNVTPIPGSSQGMLYAQPLNPIDMPNTRLKQLGQQYLRWHPVDIVMEFIPSVPSTAGGELAMGIVPDPDYDISAIGDALQRRLMALDNVQIFNDFQMNARTHMSWGVPEDVGDWFYINPNEDEDRLSSLGTFLLAQIAAASGSPAALGTLVMHYRVVMCANAINEEATGSSVSSTTLTVAAVSGNAFSPVAGAFSPALTTTTSYVARVNSLATGSFTWQWLAGSTSYSGTFGVGATFYLIYDEGSSTWRFYPVMPANSITQGIVATSSVASQAIGLTLMAYAISGQ